MHATSIYIARKQFIRHQTVERTYARSEDFHTRVMRALLHTRVFMKFKSSCTICVQATAESRHSTEQSSLGKTCLLYFTMKFVTFC